MSTQAWQSVQDELARSAERGVVTRFWLRDDDAVTVTPALDRLASVCAGAGMPILLAVIPAEATQTLAEWVGSRSLVTPCQHGWAHRNHAAAEERACELGGTRLDPIVLDELSRGREVMRRLFGAGLADVLVPPWNRIRLSLIPALRGAGYGALSTFGPPAPERTEAIAELNCDLDLIDWRNGRRGRTIEDLCRRLVSLIRDARQHGRPIGLLTHHLAHDEAVWTFLDLFFDRLRDHPAAACVAARTLPATIA